MFSAFNCIKLGDKYYLSTDASIVCYEGSHKLVLLTIVLPSIILWVIGIPLYALISLIKNRKII
jgi:hypothetical protein